MSRQSEPEEQSAASNSEKSSGNKATDDSTPPSNAKLLSMLVRLKLKLIAHYAILAFAPIVAVLALITAVISVTGNQTSQEQLNKTSAAVESMSAKLLVFKGEMEKLNTSLAQEKAIQEEEQKKQDERMTKIIQNINRLQVKMKISPTLEEQLIQATSAPIVTPAAASTAVSSPAASSAVPVATAPVKAAVSIGAEKKPDTQAKILKEAIEKFNK